MDFYSNELNAGGWRKNRKVNLFDKTYAKHSCCFILFYCFQTCKNQFDWIHINSLK